MTSFKRKLLGSGCSQEPVEFYQNVQRLFIVNCSGFETDEQLKRHPREAIQFCDLVRTELNLCHLPDELILGALENFRKRALTLEKASVA
jgi:hypothetical protein